MSDQTPTEDIGLALDMLDADRMLKWAENVEAFGPDLTNWASTIHVTQTLRALSEHIRESVRDSLALRSALALTRAQQEAQVALRAEVAALKEIIGTYDGDGVAADCSLAIATLVSETGGEANYSRADREIHDALARGVAAGRQVTLLLADQERMREALKDAEQFIVNGVEYGYIQMPDADCPDSAHGTLPKIRAALSSTPRQA